MPTTVHQASPPPRPFQSASADISLTAFGDGVVGAVLSDTFLDFGSVIKGVIDSVLYVMFEIPDAAGTNFDSIQFKLNFEFRNGLSGAHPFWFGMLVKDGTWEIQTADPPKGVGKYLTFGLFQKGSAEVHSNWVGGSASIVDSLNSSFGFVAGDPVLFGSVGTNSHFEDNQFLADFQSAFDNNQSDRNDRGVPVFLHLYPQLEGVERLYRFSSQNHATEAFRPTLTLVTPVLDQGVIYDVVAKPSQLIVNAKTSQLAVVEKLSALDVVAKDTQIEATEKSSTLEVTAKPDTIDVTEA